MINLCKKRYKTEMKRYIFTIIAAFLLLSACGGQSALNAGSTFNPRDTVNVPEGLTGEDSIAYIENMIVKSPITANDLLGLAEVHYVEESLTLYGDLGRPLNDPYYREDPQTEHRDSAAMRLANRFLRMGNLVNLNGNANDKLQWAVAVNAAIDTFLVAVPYLNSDSVIHEIGRVVYKYSNQTQGELNFMCYVDAMVDYYRTIESYRQWLASAPTSQKPLIQKEYEAWHDFNEARFAFWNDVSYRQEWYSMKPMEVEGYYENLSANRRAELQLERGIIENGNSYHQKGKTVTSAQWEQWITDHSVPEDAEDMKEYGREDELPSDSIVTDRVNALKTAFSRWMAARKAIAAALPKQQGNSYDNLTADIHCRMIGKLDNIIPYGEW